MPNSSPQIGHLVAILTFRGWVAIVALALVTQAGGSPLLVFVLPPQRRTIQMTFLENSLAIEEKEGK